MDPYNLIEIDTKLSPQLKFEDFPVDPPAESSEHTPTKKSALSFDFYRQLFDVNTDDVVGRIKWSVIPTAGDFMKSHIKPKPDLYGPFWISVTLVFSIAVSGNMANYLQTAASRNYHWQYDFHIVSLAATTILCYTWILPLVIWLFLKWFTTQEETANLLELICVYGYCMSVYVPISILWIIQINWLQWLLVFLGAALSGSVLIPSVYPLLGSKKIPLGLMLSVLHLLMATSFMLYFFHVPDNPVKVISINKTIVL